MNGSSSALRECVVERLELTSKADDEAFRQALIRQLQTEAQDAEAGHEPALEVGACLVAGRQIRRPVAAPIERAHARKCIEDLCSRFFELSPDKRTREFEQVRTECERFRELTARLMALKPGLDVRVDDLESLPEPTQTLARHACELFVLPPMERIQRSREILRTELPKTPVATVSSLKADAAPIAELCPRFLDNVTALGMQDAIARSEVRKRARELKSGQTWSSQSQSADSGADSRNYWWIIVAVLFGMVRLAGMSSPSSRFDTSSASRPFSVEEMQRHMRDSSGLSPDNRFQSPSADLRNRLNGYRNSGALSKQNVDPVISQFVTDELMKRRTDPDRRSERIVTSMDDLRSRYATESPASKAGFLESPTLGGSATTDATQLLDSPRSPNGRTNTHFEVVTADSFDDLNSKVEEVKDRIQNKGRISRIRMIRSDQLAARPFNEINDILPYVAPTFAKSLTTPRAGFVSAEFHKQIQTLVNTCDKHVKDGRVFSPQAAAALEQLRHAL